MLSGNGSRPLIVPAPKVLHWHSSEVVGNPPVSWERDTRLGPEGFGITAAPGGIRVRFSGTSGRRYAAGVLADIRKQSPSGFPGFELEDAPDFPVRGLMLDVSRDRVPTRETLLRWLDVMVTARLNHLQLYVEHTFAYRDHETVWRDASPLTPDDVRWLDAECSMRGIELAANLNTFGHMGRWLQHDTYRSRAEAPDGWMGPMGSRRAPAVLAPTPDNAAFAVGLANEMRSCFQSPRVNIGCDETFELGMGRSLEEVASRGRERVYLEHVKRILEPLHEAGAEVLFWGDILRSHPELVGELPPDRVVALAWHYEAPFRWDALPAVLREKMRGFGMTSELADGFRSQVPGFVASGVPYWVCPGTSSWNSLVGRASNARANLLDAARVGAREGAEGFLVTDWGDNGHLQPPSVSFEPVLYAGAVAWGAAQNDDVDVAAWLDRSVFEDSNGRLGAAVTALAAAGERTGLHAYNASPLFEGVFPGRCLVAGDLDVAATQGIAHEIARVAANIAAARPRCADGDIVVRELCQAARLAELGALRLLEREGVASVGRVALDASLRDAIDEQRACWRLRSREGGLADSAAKLEALL